MAATTDERWRACQDLGNVGEIIKGDGELIGEVIGRLKDALKNDDSGIVRYHAVRSLGRLCPSITKRRPELVFEIGDLLIVTAQKDSYDRVRRGAMFSLTILGDMQKKRPEVTTKVREACAKVLENDKYDIVRCDAATMFGKLGPPPFVQVHTIMGALDEAYNKDSCKLVRTLAKLALHKLGRLKIEDVMNVFEKDIKELEKYIVTIVHWSYWSQRECIARALGELGPLLPHLPESLNRILNILESFTADPVWDVRCAACRALGDLAPAVTEGGFFAGGAFDEKGADADFQRELHRRAMPILQRARRDNNADVREAAMDALSK